MQKIIDGVKKFQSTVVPTRQAEFERLASGQAPEVLFITCSDSRIDPCLLTQTVPGQLFICRNAGNVVPPHSNQTGGMTASIEYAIAVLGVEHIIVCGHTDCGAMKGATDTSQLGDLPHVKEWLGHCRAATAVVKEKHGCVGTEHLEEVTCENIKLQMQHLRTHPVVAAKLATNQLKLHGWMYQLETGGITVYDEKSDQFVSIQEI